MFRTQGVMTTKAALALQGLPAGPLRAPAGRAVARGDDAAQDRSRRRRGTALTTDFTTEYAEPPQPAHPHDNCYVHERHARHVPHAVRGARGEESLLSHPHPELGAPPKLPKGGLRVTPLGGLGEIGRNMTVFEYGGRLLIVDCGVLFPEEEQPGIDLILPDFTSIRDRLDDIEGIVLTHGHEDHIGAVPYLLREKPDIPLIGSKLTLALIEAKLQEHRIRPYTLEVARATASASAPSTASSSPSTTPSRTPSRSPSAPPPAWSSHTGDFKMDQLPLDGRLTDLHAFARLSEEGIDLLLSDSTNAEVPGFVPPERDISNVLRQVFAERPASGSSWPASPATSTASSRSWTPPTSTAAGSPSSAARWSATWASPATSAT